MGGSGMQWSFSNTNSQLLSFKSAQERTSGAGVRGGHHKLASPTFSQRNLALDKQGGNHYPFSTWQHSDTSHPPPEGRIFPLATQTTQMVTPASVVPPPNFPVVGSTDIRNSSNISPGPCQLTIFYNGSVCVYNNVSPEKAQAIMLLAGNSDSMSSNATLSSAPKIQPAAPKPLPHEAANSSPSLGFSGSISLAPPVNSRPAIVSTSAAQVNPVRPILVPALIKPSEVPKSGPVVATAAARPNFIPSAVPQARKASLARFLEKRKERVISASPYAVSKNTSECSTAGPGGLIFASNSASSSPVPAGN